VLTEIISGPLAAHPGGGWGPGFGWFFLFIPLFWISVIALLAFGARRWRRAEFAQGYGPRWGQPARAAESTLGERYAQGDIDEKEYRARLEVLRANAYPDKNAK
jgi:putative membrane protein